MRGVVFEHIDHIVQIHERIVNRYDLDALMLERGAENQTANAAKAIDTNFRVRHNKKDSFRIPAARDNPAAFSTFDIITYSRFSRNYQFKQFQ